MAGQMLFPAERGAPTVKGVNIGVTWFPHWMLCKAYPGYVPEAERVLERNGWRFGQSDTCWRQLNWAAAREHSSPLRWKP